MSNKIFLIGNNNKLSAMEEQPYDSEDILQELLEEYPDLLAGEQVDSDNPRRWLLITREMGVADDDNSADRWSIDHLFLDQDGIPTLVEVKRSTDTRVRREVVGQMLDYAANAVLYWPEGKIKAAFEETCRSNNRDPVAELAKHLSNSESTGPADVDAFWHKVHENLELKRIRLVFVADAIPRELQRIVEFLNEDMENAEVLAIDLKQFVNKETKQKTLVPRVIGQTTRSESRKSSGKDKRSWDRGSFMKECCAESGEPVVRVMEKLIKWFEGNANGVKWGHGQSATFTTRAIVNGEDTELMRVFQDGEIQFALMRLESNSVREELRARLLAIQGLNLEDSKGYPSAHAVTLADEDVWKALTDTYKWLFSKITAGQPETKVNN